MAQNAELLLKVGLDLSHFRQQLTAVGSQLAGQPLPINVKFDRQKIVSEFRLLDRYIRNKKFYVEVNTNLKTEVDRAVRLTELLKNMPRGGGAARTPGVVEAGFSQAQLKKLKQDIKPLYKAAADAGLVAFDETIAKNVEKIAKALSEVGKSSITGLLNGLSSGDAQVRAAARNLGNALISTIKATLGIASPSKETGKLGKFAAQGFEQGFVSGIVKAERSMARAIRSALMGAIREGFGNLPGMSGALVSFERQLAASVQLAVRKAVRQGLASAITPGAKGGLLGGTGGAITGATVGGAKALGTGVAGGVAKFAAGGLMGMAGNLARYSVDSSAYQEFVGKLYQEIIHAALSTGSQGAIIGALAVGGVAGGLGFARGASGSLILQAVTAIRNRILAALLAVSTGDLNNIVKVVVRDVTGLVFQGAIKQLRAAMAQMPAINWPAQLPSRTPAIGPSSTGRLLTGAAPMQALAGAQSPAGLLSSVSQSTARRSSVAAGLQAILDADRSVFPEEPPGKLFPLGPMLQMLRERLEQMLSVETIRVGEDIASDLKRALHGFAMIANALDEAMAAAKKARIEAKVAQLVDALEQAIDAANARLRMRPVQVAVATPQMLPGTTFGAQKRLIGDILDPSLKAILRDAANAFVDAVRQQMNSAVRSVTVRDLGAPPQSLLKAAPSEAPPLMLPAAGQTTARQRVRISGGGFTGQGYVPPSGFPSDGPLGGRQGPATFIGAGSQMEKFKTALDVAGQSMKQFRANQIPLVGALRELGGEFGMAVKQVLLYGTAYKGLAFITGLPGQILNAAKSQQQYTNALQTVTEQSGTFAKELLYVDNVQRAFGLNLETTRTGFTRLYASMAPSGFDSGAIEKLFTGISAATAALQLTPDKAERVIYAFGQMASKGQIMSEELKGQLGDVLPGALALFAEAAGMSVKDFSKAMEDGAFVGGKFREVFAKVSDELMNRFGTGAAAAGRSLQGLLNTLQGDFQRTLEAFSPLANAAAEAILVPLSSTLNQLSKAAQIATGEIERVEKQLADAKAADANAESIAALEARLTSLQNAAKDPAIANQAKQIEAFASEISRAASDVMNLAQNIGGILGPILSGFGTNITTIVGNLTILAVSFTAIKIAAMSAMAVMSTMATIEGISRRQAAAANILVGAYRLLGVQATAAQVATIGFGAAVKGLLASTGIGLLVVVLGSVAAAFMNVGNRAAEAAAKSQAAIQQMRDAIASGNTALVRAQLATTRQQRQAIEDAAKTLQQIAPKERGGERAGGAGLATTTLAQRELFRQAGFDVGASKGGRVDVRQLSTQLPGLRAEAKTREQQQVVGVEMAAKQERRLGFNKPGATPVTQETAAGPSTKGGAGKAANDAKRLAEEIARQAAAASDALFAEQQRLLVLQQTNPTAKAIVEYTNQELAIQRELNKSLKEAKGEKEKVDLKEVARLKSSSNLLELQNGLNDAGKEGLQRLEDAIKTQKEELFVNGEIEKLLREKVSPERAKQIADTRLLVNKQLESLDLSIGQAEAAVEEAKARGASVTAIEDAIAALKQRRSEIVGKGAQLEAGIPMEGGPKTARDYLMESADEARKNLEQLTNQGYQLAQVANSIGDAFGNAFKGLITGSMTAQEALAGFFSSVADHFADMVAKMIAEWLKAQLIQGFMNFISAIIPGAGALGSVAAGLSGTGALASGGIKGFSGGSMAGLPTSYGTSTGGLGSITGGGGFGNWTGPRFANGAIVTGPTLGLVGEGRYNEAIVPLPDGRSIPVELGGGMGGVNVVVNVDATGSEAAGNEGQAKALGNAISAAVQSEIIKQKRPGGLLAR